jgi:S-adenosylmethionine hydrolase
MITLLTDFGHHDPLVGIMKGVILAKAPDTCIVDLAHEVPPHNVTAAAFFLMTSWSYFPEETIHCVVVDPGVGSDRPILCARYRGHLFLAPDNGVLSWAIPAGKPAAFFAVENRSFFLPNISRTFHGRDIFAPVAAELEKGLDPARLGPPATSPKRLPFRTPKQHNGRIKGEVLWIDRFGNGITNIPETLVASWREGTSPASVSLLLGETRIDGIVEAYAAVPVGQPLGILGSSGYLEIAAHQAHAASLLNFSIGTPVTLDKGQADPTPASPHVPTAADPPTSAPLP